MSHSGTDGWLAFTRPSATARVRLFCFPHAGLGASVFRSWVGTCSPDIDVCPVQYPGRESRHRETPFSSMAALADAVADALRPYFDVPFALFGHSMGALAAFEIARRVDRTAGVAHLFVSARRAPHVPDRLPPLGVLDDRQFIDEIQRRYGGIPGPVLECDDLMALLLPRLRADVATLEGYTFGQAQRLSCPISAFGGDGDDTVTVGDLEAWREHSRSHVRVRLMRGGHLFLQQQRDALLACIRADLALVEPEAVQQMGQR